MSSAVSPSISVIIPTYNRVDFLREAVTSVIRQTYDDYEIIVVDDASDDDTESLMRAEPAVRYVRLSRRLFPSAVRNRGAAVSRGRYIAFLDSDDLWKPDKLAEQYSFLKRHQDIRICHTDEIWIRNGRRVNQKKKHAKSGGCIFSRCLHRCLISPSSVMMEKSLFNGYGGFDESIEIAEDFHLWLRITANEEIGFIPKKLTVKRGGHGDQLSHKYGFIEIFRITAMEKVLKEGVLSPEQEDELKGVLCGKYRVYIQGCKKRGNISEARKYERRLREISGLTFLF